MAFKTFTDGVALPASDINTYLMKQANIGCTSGTRPSSPVEGMQIYETDLDGPKFYTTATTGWQKPWNMPWGYVGYAQITANQTGIGTTLTTVTGLSIAFTYVANRRILIEGFVRVQQNTGGGNPELSINEGATQIERHTLTVTAGTWGTATPKILITPTAGSHTYDLRLITSNNTCDAIAASTQPAWIMITDLGPNGAPA